MGDGIIFIFGVLVTLLIFGGVGYTVLEFQRMYKKNDGEKKPRREGTEDEY